MDVYITSFSAQDAIVNSGIPIIERYDLPDELIPADSRVEIDAKVCLFLSGKKREVKELNSATRGNRSLRAISPRGSSPRKSWKLLWAARGKRRRGKICSIKVVIVGAFRFSLVPFQGDTCACRFSLLIENASTPVQVVNFVLHRQE
jgi:hypothetical protein